MFVMKKTTRVKTIVSDPRLAKRRKMLRTIATRCVKVKFVDFVYIYKALALNVLNLRWSTLHMMRSRNSNIYKSNILS
jgi:hypothetical protein